jgi:transposase, IS6 family
VCKPRPALFKWRHFEPAIILCAVGWYLRYSLSYRDVEELVTERGLPADHTTIWRWVQRYAPELNQRCRRELKPTNGSWRVDETYIPVAGECLSLSCRRFHGRYDRLLAFGGAGRGCRQAIFPEGLAGSWSSAAARNQRGRQPFLSEGRGGAEARAETGSPLPLSNLSYLNNNLEQDHRAIKRRVKASQGFRSLDGA